MTVKAAPRGFSAGRRRFMLLLSLLFASLCTGPAGAMKRTPAAGSSEREAMFYRRIDGKGK